MNSFDLGLLIAKSVRSHAWSPVMSHISTSSCRGLGLGLAAGTTERRYDYCTFYELSTLSTYACRFRPDLNINRRVTGRVFTEHYQ